VLEKSITFIASCDFCSEFFDTAVEAMKREGWKVFKQHSEWFHKCGSCQEDIFEEMT
jgi:hypothetical protein